MVEAKLWRLIDLARFAEKGSWPVLAGVMDQCESFMRGCQVVWAEESQYRFPTDELK